MPSKNSIIVQITLYLHVKLSEYTSSHYNISLCRVSNVYLFHYAKLRQFTCSQLSVALCQVSRIMSSKECTLSLVHNPLFHYVMLNQSAVTSYSQFIVSLCHVKTISYTVVLCQVKAVYLLIIYCFIMSSLDSILMSSIII